MEHFVVSARKYRPTTFSDVVGQQAITNTLLNAIENNHLAQALLFTGPRGVGKTTCARILAKKINQESTEASENEDFAFNIFELDAASNNSVDDIRSLTDQVRIPPQVGQYKVYIIDEVHMLSTAAFNAFLKTLEEPPKHAIFILATTEKHKIIPTILSRCQIFDFKRISVQDVKNYLADIAKKEGVDAEDDALHIIAQKADGAMRDALSIYDRVVSFSGNKLTRQAVTENLNVLDYEVYFKMTSTLFENNIPEALIQFNAILSKGFDGHHFISGLASHFRDLLVCQNEETIKLLEVGKDIKTKYYEQSKKVDRAILIKGIEMANDCDLKYRASKNQRLLVELCLMQLASLTFEGEKKKSSSFIISASHFSNRQATSSQPIARHQVAIAEANKVVITSEEYSKHQQDPELDLPQQDATTDKDYSVPSLEVKNQQRKPSALSLKGFKKKQEILAKQREAEAPLEDLPVEDFTETAFLEHWNAYIEKLKKDGQKIMASVLATDTPSIEGTHICMELPNESMKGDIEQHETRVLGYLKRKLRNYDLCFKLSVNEEVAKRYAFTPQEKYEKLRERNPLIDDLRKTFDLDL